MICDLICDQVLLCHFARRRAQKQTDRFAAPRREDRRAAQREQQVVSGLQRSAALPQVSARLWLQNLLSFSVHVFSADEAVITCKRDTLPPVSAGPSAHILTWWSSGADRWRSAMTGCSESDRTIRSGRNGPGRSPAGASPRTAAAAHTDALRGRTRNSEHTLTF